MGSMKAILILLVILLTTVSINSTLTSNNVKLDGLNMEIIHDDITKQPIIGQLGKFVNLEEKGSHSKSFLSDRIELSFTKSLLSIQLLKPNSRYEVTCQEVTWQAVDCRQRIFEDCYSLDTLHWYGGAPIQNLQWPIEKWDLDYSPFVSGDAINTGRDFGGVLERYWINSNGDGFFIGSESPLWVSINASNSQQICFRATYDESPYLNHDNSPLFLNYTICQSAGMMEMQRYAIDTYLGRPTDIPDELLFHYPIYSTWARFKKDINQTLVLDYAREINSYNFSNAQMEIDDHWEINYGRLDFDPEKFPDPAAMVTELSNLGFRTTLWVHPFVDLASDYTWWGTLFFIFLKDPGGLLPALTTWWNGVAVTLDYTDPDAVAWWMEHLTDLKLNYGINSFKFDAGEAHWFPESYAPYQSFRNPSDYTTIYAELAFELDKDVRHQEVRIGWHTQHLPIFTRLLDKDSHWSHDNGLKSVIPHVFLFSIIGYVFPLPDMIGGNAYNEQPDRELFIRWTEVNVFLPGFQFSIAPWQYDQEVIDICRAMLQLHEQYADLLIELAVNATVTGEPIIRPLWWIAPTDPVAQEIDSEFLVGNDLLSAPVLDPGAVSRDIYLPAGRWRDMNDPDIELDGGMWYLDYAAPLDMLPYFTRIV